MTVRHALKAASPRFDVALDSQAEVSLSKLLNMLRRHFDMDLAFIAKFEQGNRTALLVDSGELPPSPNLCFSHPVEETYCKKIADGELPEVIPDTRKNAITRAMPVTVELDIGAYMGVPIHLPNGELYGTLCCLKHSPEPGLAPRDAALLRFVSEVAAQKIHENHLAETRLIEINDRIEKVVRDDALQMHYQPIWAISEGGVCAFEALARFNVEPYATPDVWFSQADQVGQRDHLEVIALERALECLKDLPDQCYLSLNASPEAILSGSVGQVLEKVEPHRVVLEITEHSKVWDYAHFRDAVRSIRARGVRLAIDDAGAGYASFQHVMELEADIIKLDLSLIRDIHLHTKKQALASALISYARHTNSEIVAEGVECLEEFELLRRLGVDKLQGYYIAKPMPTLVFDCFPT